MKKIFAFFTLIALCSASLLAQITHTSQGDIDKTANSLLKKAAAKMSGTVSFNVTVVQLDANKKETLHKKVDVLYRNPSYRMKAGSLEVYCNGTTVWQLNKSAKEVVISPMTDADDDLTNPGRLLANYSKSFKAKYIRTEKDGTAIVDLQPNKSSNYHKVRLFIDSKTGLLKKVEQHFYDSSRTTYTVSNFKNTKAADTDFVYNTKANPSIEVVDMR